MAVMYAMERLKTFFDVVHLLQTAGRGGVSAELTLPEVADPFMPCSKRHQKRWLQQRMVF